MSRFQSLLAVKISTLPRRVFRIGTVAAGFDGDCFSLGSERAVTSLDSALGNAGRSARDSASFGLESDEEGTSGAGFSGKAVMARPVGAAGVVVEAEFPNESVSVPRKNEVTATSRYSGGWLDGFMTVSCLTGSLLKASYLFQLVLWNLLPIHFRPRQQTVWLPDFHSGVCGRGVSKDSFCNQCVRKLRHEHLLSFGDYVASEGLSRENDSESLLK